ncbi:DMT family transporter [Allokutzneria oryzae]|uniref:DMT family transporter n=1 Tax=Allokutzneria oryzae TaxID=1378989 RepID=A0ABV6A242_9PSEU
MRIPAPVAIGTVLIWTSGYLLGALAVDVVPPYLLTTVRLTLGALLMGAIALVTGARRPRGRLLLHVCVAGVLTQAVQFAGVYGGLQAGVPAAVTALVMALNPVLTAVMVTGLLGERVGRKQVVGLVLGVLSVVAVLGERVLEVGLDAGSLLTLLGLFGFAVGGIYQQRFCSGADVRAASTVQMAVSAPVVGVLALFEDGTVTDWTGAGLIALWLVLVNALLGTSLYLEAVRRGGARRASSLFSVVPAVTAIAAWPVLGELPSLGALAGLGLGAAACVLGTSTAAEKTRVAKDPVPRRDRAATVHPG